MNVEDRAAAVVRAWASSTPRPSLAGKLAIRTAALELLLADADPQHLVQLASEYGLLAEDPTHFARWVRSGHGEKVVRAWWAVER